MLAIATSTPMDYWEQQDPEVVDVAIALVDEMNRESRG